MHLSYSSPSSAQSSVTPYVFSGAFEPPGADSVAAFVNEYDELFDPRLVAGRRRTARTDDAVLQVSAGEVQSRLASRWGWKNQAHIFDRRGTFCPQAQ